MPRKKVHSIQAKALKQGTATAGKTPPKKVL